MGEVERRKGDISSRESSAPLLPAMIPGVKKGDRQSWLKRGKTKYYAGMQVG
jgi:hypothetical protein